MTAISGNVAFRLLFEDEDGNIKDTEHDYGLEDFGGIPPSVGDLIVDPWVEGGLDRRKPENRKIMVVEKRYIQPRSDPGPDGTTSEDVYYVNLVVRSRKALEVERLVACRN